MQIQFLGATRTVTGSKFLITTDNKKYLVDCGLFQGLKELRLRNWIQFPLAPKSIDAVFLTHAHLDHSGYIPLLVKNGFAGKVYCTQSTCELSEVLLLDSAHLQEEEARRANKYGYSKHKPALPLYDKNDVVTALKQLSVVPFDQDFMLDSGFSVDFRVAGHILGAASVMLKYQGKSVLFSGDLGRPNDPCIFPPEKMPDTDYLVIESTYGDRLHEQTDPQQELCNIINRTVRRGGTIIIPAFAVGRTQSILYSLYKLKQAGEIANVPIFLDSPMAQAATNILSKHLHEHKLSEADCVASCSVAEYITSVEDSKLIDTYNYPKIIISASGMATGGRVLHHIKVFAGDSRNTILFAGFQAAGTRGEAMVNGKKEIKMLGEVVPINAEVISLSNVSAHTDYNETLAWLKQATKPPRKVFITHGEIKAAESLKEKIEANLGWLCDIPDYLQIAEL